MKERDCKTLAYVLQRTNYMEADRILSIITPEGKKSVIAKGARKSKSKLAGGVEMFSLSELNIHQGRGKMGLVTSAKMLKYYDKIVASFDKLELAAMFLKKISAAAESSDSPEYFKLLDMCLIALNGGMQAELVQSYFLLNLLKISGEEINVYRDTAGEKLDAEKRYEYDALEGAFTVRENGRFGVDEIKIIRLILVAELDVVSRVKNIEKFLPVVVGFSRNCHKMI